MADRPEDEPPLGTYRAKRSADRTPEPFGSDALSAAPSAGDWRQPRLFVVQKHHARRLHWDFRLEWGGVLRSWAVPHGPSPDPVEKRLAMHVEDHPVEYADFEGVIPKDNYGAGPSIVWDRGVWIAVEDPEAGWVKGKLLFELRGYKLRGEWTLVRTKGRGREQSQEWLLIKHADAWSGPEAQRGFGQESVLSGLTVEELRAGSERARGVRENLVRLGAPRAEVRGEDVKPMLGTTADTPFSSPEWVYELKYDGYRVLLERAGKTARVIYRKGHDAGPIYPELTRCLLALPFERFLLDGEVVVLDDDGRPSFARLQKRALLQRPSDAVRAALAHPATLYVFDLLAFEDFDVRPLPLVARKELLQQLLPHAGPIRYCDHVPEQGEAFFAEVQRLGLEGVMAKRADAPYRAGRSPHWLKFKAEHTADYVIVGFTEPDGARVGFGALHLGAFQGQQLVYVGRAGTGFDDALLRDIRGRLEPLRRGTPACTGELVPKGAEHAWVEPQLVCEVRHNHWTGHQQLRQAVFLRLRLDKRPQECRLESEPADEPALEIPAAVQGADVERKVAFTNLNKVFWPEERYSKGDLIEYYRAIAPHLLPYLADRPLVLTRYPDGINGKNFFQKDAPGFAPGWVRTERMWSEHAEREIDYFVCDQLETLLYLANLGTIPLHVWSSRVATLALPDWCILDLDPKGAPFAHVVRLALEIRALTTDIGLPAFIKTSGATGLHVLLPLGRQCTYEQSRTLGELLARVIVAAQPEIATITRQVEARGGRVYIDYLQNGHGRLLVGPFSVRPLPGAPVSTPLEWDEVGPDLNPRAFTIKTVLPRVARQAVDPLLKVLDLRPDLASVLESLGRRISASSTPPTT